MRVSVRDLCLNFVCAAVLGLTCVVANAREAVVTTYDGRTLSGELVNQDAKTVTLLISGIKTPIARDAIQSIEIKDAPEEQYRKMRAELADDDLDGRYRLAYSMYEKKWYVLAMTELESLGRQFPDNEKVHALGALVKSKLDAEQDDNRTEQKPVQPEAPNVVTEVADMPGPDQRLTNEQINVIRVYEADLDAQPNVTIPPDTIDKLYKNYASDDRLIKDRKEFNRMPGYEQLKVLFSLQARDLYPEVTIRQDSPAFKAFRAQIHQRYILSFCATNGCHGDGSPGNLYLFRIQSNSDATVYTNYYILNRIHNAQGAMVDRDEPRRSLLLQYGLKREAAATPHPDVPGWRPQFIDEKDPRFIEYTDIINRLWKPAPEYGITYSPPVWRKNTEQTPSTDQPKP